jgi:glutamate/tyrosine decarboxylase-like PLP-dependent enzyme
MLTELISADRRIGLTPFCVVGSAGTTNTGSVDPLSEIAEVCRDSGLWFHVDGAYGAAAVITPRGAAALHGIEEADSLALDPHKWLFQPYEIGCTLVKRKDWLIDTFRILPEYLHDTRREEAAVNFCDYGIQLTRSFRALKLWMSIKAFGMQSFRRAVERGFDLAEFAEGELAAVSDWEIVTPANMGILTFRFVGAQEHRLDELNRSISEELSRGGYAFLSTTRLQGRTVLRFCTINPRTTEADLRETIRRLDEIARTLIRSA